MTGLTALLAALVVSHSAAAEPRRGRIAAPPAMVTPTPAHDRTALVYEVYDPHGSETVFLATRALTPTTPAELFRVDHAESYPPRASVSPDGALIAMTRLPPGARRDSPAELVLVGPTSRARRTVATDAHYFTTPIVTPRAVFYLRQSLAAEVAAEEQRQVHVALVRYDLVTASSRVLFESTLVDLALLGAARDGGELIALKRAHASAAEVVAFDPDTGALRTIARAAAGRDLLRASLDMGGRFVLLTELAPGAAEVELSQVPARGGAAERLQRAPASAPPAVLADGLLVRASGPELTLDRAGASRALRGPLPNAKDAALVGLSPDGRFIVARWLAGPSQVYQVVDASAGMTALPAPRGGDLFGMNADVVGFIQPAASGSLGGAP